MQLTRVSLFLSLATAISAAAIPVVPRAQEIPPQVANLFANFSSYMNNPEFIAQLDAANNPEDAAELAKQLIAQIKAQKGSIPDNLAGPFSTYLEALEDSKVSTDMRSIMNELVSFVEGVKEISPEVFGLKPTKAAASTSTGPSPLPTSKATQDADDVDEQVSTSAAAANGPSKMGLGLVSMGVAMGVISVLF